MSKYTSNDIEVTSLDQGDRINFEFDMLNHDVEKNVELSYGASVAKKPSAITDSITDWKKLATTILMCACGGLLIAVVLMIIVFIILIFFGEKKEQERTMLSHVAISCILLLVVVFILYTIFNRMKGEMNTLINVSKVDKSIS
jgi:heme/copper-type cytochrome/quinol oxidase subunit 4